MKTVYVKESRVNEIVVSRTLDNIDNDAIRAYIDKYGGVADTWFQDGGVTHEQIHQTFPEAAKLEQEAQKLAVEWMKQFWELGPERPFQTDSLEAGLAKTKFVTTQMWGSKIGKGGKFNEHEHWPHTFAFWYYVGSSDVPCTFPEMDLKIEAEEGKLNICRGHLEHWCGHNDTTKEKYRYVVAGNMSAIPDGRVVTPDDHDTALLEYLCKDTITKNKDW